MHIPLSCPDLNEDDRCAVLEVLNSTALSLGPRLPEFEAAICSATGARYAIAVNSGTSGLHLAVKAAGLGPGDEVLTTPFSFVASANCILFERAVPVFVDIDETTYNIDAEQLERAITPRTRAILMVHVFGRPCNIKAIKAIADQYRLSIIEDSCEALGARYRGVSAGRFGQTGVFAFYPNKQITTGEGGVVVTDDPATARLCRSWRNQGRSDSGDWLEHERLGFNYRMSDINCALGISQMRRLRQIVADRAHVAHLYDDTLATMPFVTVPPIIEPECDISWFVYVVRLTDSFTREDRDSILAELSCRGIGCRNYFAPIHLQPFYKESFSFEQGMFPVTERVSERTIALPFFTSMSREQVHTVCMCLADAVDSVRRTRSWPDAMATASEGRT